MLDVAIWSEIYTLFEPLPASRLFIAQLDENRFGSALGFTKEHLGQSTK